MSTDWQELVHQLQATNSKMEVALEVSTEAVVFVGEDRRVQWCNQAFAHLVNRSYSQIFGSRFSDLLALRKAGQSVDFKAYPDRQIQDKEYQTTVYEFEQDEDSLVLQISGTCGGLFDNKSAVLVIRDITQRQQAKAAPQATRSAATLSEARLNTILSSAVACIQRNRLYGDRTWEFEYVSGGCELIYGYTASEIIEDNHLLAKRVHPEDWENVIQPMFDCIFAEQPGEHEHRYLHPDGNWRWICLNITSVWDEEASCWMVTLIASDITDKKHAEIALTESEFKFRSIVENAGDVLCILNLEGVVRYVSPNIMNLIGFSPAEMEGQSFETFVHPDDMVQLREAYQQLATTGERISRLEYCGIHRDGRWIWQLANLSSFVDANGELLLVGVVKDITQRKQAEAALRESEAKFRALYESIDVASLLTNETGIFDVNSAAEQLFGYSRQEFMGKHPGEISPPLQPNGQDSLSLVNQQLAIAVDQGSHRFEWMYRRADGTDFPAEVWLTWVEVGDRKLMHGIIQDLTQRKRTETALAERARLAAFRADLGSALAQSDSLPTILNTCAIAAVKHLMATFAQIWTFNPQEDVFELKASAGVYTQLDRDDSRVPISRFFVGGVPEPYITNNLAEDPNVIDLDWVKREKLVATAHYPILLDQELLGLLEMFARQPLSESTLEALQFAATEIALGIKRKQAEAELEHRVKVESLLSSISRQFIDQDIKTAMQFTLAAIANFMEVDRSYIVEFSDDQRQYSLIYQWCAADIAPLSNEAQEGILTNFPWLHNKILNRQVVEISSLAEFPPEAAAQRETFPSQSIESLLAVPMTHAGKVVGCLSVDIIRCVKTWTQDHINVLKLVGELIAISRARHKAEEALRQSEAREREKAKELELTLGELKRTQANLIQTEKMSSLGRLVAGVAHEINNPISFIGGNLTYARRYFQDLLDLVQLYQATYPNPTQEIQQRVSQIDLNFLVQDWSKLMNSMQVGAKRIQEIVLSLRNFSRLDENDLKSVDIHQGIDNTLLILQHRLKAEGRRPEIQVIKDYDPLPKVTCYASQLNQVFMNLINNAIDAVETQPDSRVITIHTLLIQNYHQTLIELPWANIIYNHPVQTPNPQSVVILVTDNGPGMSKEILHKIFDPFFTTKPVGSGTGLGLSISYQIVVEKHRGQLSCISAPGYGTAFIVDIPLNVTALSSNHN